MRDSKSIGQKFVARLFIGATLLIPCIAFAQDASVPPPSLPISKEQPNNAALQIAIKPDVIYVTDFFLDPTGIDKEKLVQHEGTHGRRHGRRSDEDPAAKAHKLVEVLAQSIVGGLTGAGQKAVHLPSDGGNVKGFPPSGVTLPKQGWLVGGWFVKVDEGNRAMEAVVGFGAGSVHVEIEVVASDLGNKPEEPFLFMGSESKSKVRPGGMVKMNPYAMAAKFALSKGATEKDVKEQGAAIAAKLMAYVSAGSADSK